VAESFEDGNETFGSIKCWEFVEQLSNGQHLKNTLLYEVKQL
jgi:hypothetical protein